MDETSLEKKELLQNKPQEVVGVVAEYENLPSELRQKFQESYDKFGFSDRPEVGDWVVRDSKGKPMGVAERRENSVCMFTPWNIHDARMSCLPTKEGGFTEVAIRIPHPTKTESVLARWSQKEGFSGTGVDDGAKAEAMGSLVEFFMKDDWEDEEWERKNGVEVSLENRGLAGKKERAVLLFSAGTLLVASGLACTDTYSGSKLEDAAATLQVKAGSDLESVVEGVEGAIDEGEEWTRVNIDEPGEPIRKAILGSSPARSLEEVRQAWEKLTDSDEWEKLGEEIQNKIHEIFTDPEEAQKFIEDSGIGLITEEVDKIEALDEMREKLEEMSNPNPVSTPDSP